ncbi:hypothetical protein GCM10011497_12780 [Elstera cyanobacteriorum]|uniref:Amidinotransferase n=1 Tax=Elstera cyanobacteriorum TaxID=2022747 RepID=A0A255XLS5_9PROT|nr:arginine deiminase-related protein [Elstera cyanobacteriorum]OYQ17919.1 amidinotransferase [Elstera cyanobacteriorum]GFZ85140.1 hypothetical protein GCM10011497_12780 [Elstera cyanobacteriorum]
MPNAQSPAAVVMIRPHHFTPNPATAADNAFQSAGRLGDAEAAYREVSAVAAALTAAGVKVHLFEDDTTATPDSVFPNNWFSTHAGGHIAVYPMVAENRRRERRWDIIEFLKQAYRVQDVIDYSGLAADGVFLEGTGAMVLDHSEHVAYAARSPRMSPLMLERFCTHFRFEPLVFDAIDPKGIPVYHTNVLMSIGTGFALVGLDMIPDDARRQEVAERLTARDRTLIPLTAAQVGNFAGNALELQTPGGPILALSARAWESLTPPQRHTIERHARPLPLAIPTLEKAGGSIRCMLAGIHLSPRP